MEHGDHDHYDGSMSFCYRCESNTLQSMILVSMNHFSTAFLDGEDGSVLLARLRLLCSDSCVVLSYGRGEDSVIKSNLLDSCAIGNKLRRRMEVPTAAHKSVVTFYARVWLLFGMCFPVSIIWLLCA